MAHLIEIRNFYFELSEIYLVLPTDGGNSGGPNLSTDTSDGSLGSPFK